MAQAGPEEEYIVAIRSLERLRDGVLDDEVRSAPKAFWPEGATAGPFRCGEKAMPHNRVAARPLPSLGPRPQSQARLRRSSF